jgi:hypothetical protein
MQRLAEMTNPPEMGVTRCQLLHNMHLEPFSAALSHRQKLQVAERKVLRIPV